MKITLLQQDIAWADPVENQRCSEEMILAAPHSDLYVLPEMWSTGFGKPSDFADGSSMIEGDACNASSLEWMRNMASRTDSAIAGSLAVKAEDGTWRNRFYFVRPDGTSEHYDKRHLFTYGNEHLSYAGGNERKIVEWRGVRFLLQVCYDLRFPVFSRNIAVKNEKGEDGALYDCAIYVASWPTSRIKPWNILLKARALENQCYVAGVNRIGDDPVCSYCGGTQFVDPYGRVVSVCEENAVQSITSEIDMERLKAFRQKFPVLLDADEFSL